ncbi:tetratricopeptide repeat protein, tpr [Anopheles darlingi]|uniref:Tetratricopeptide repeat protein, tpr n=1 Tax=Anopheles darlingi TaxID=43151 RepID=W5JSM4_ANODA|nr:tetratricopeptide repeat protein, tpr [Anopheles darlingi]
MDNFFAAISLFRRRKYDECIEVCNGLLLQQQPAQHNALHQGPWELKMRSMTQRVYIDDVEADDDVAGIPAAKSTPGDECSAHVTSLQRPEPAVAAACIIVYLDPHHAATKNHCKHDAAAAAGSVPMASATRGTDDGPQDILDTQTIATAPRPGTSIRTAKPMATATGTTTTTAANRPRTGTGRPITGISRPGTLSLQRPGSTLGNRTAPRTASRTAGGSARQMRLGSASMFAAGDPTGPLFHISRLHPDKYADRDALSKPLFQYLYYHEGDIRKAMALCDAVLNRRRLRAGPDEQDELAQPRSGSARLDTGSDWWWNTQKARCLIAIGCPREAEPYLRKALQELLHPDVVLLLARIYVKIDQPMAALEVCRTALEKLPNEIVLLTQQARILELVGNLTTSVRRYRQIAVLDPMNTEALACIAVSYFYANQPETALLYYRRILALGAHSAELYCNIGLCCLYGGQLDLVFPCFQRALRMATGSELRADIWYNLSFVAMTTGDIHLARRCLRLCIAANGSHGSALNNMAVLVARQKQYHKAKSYLVAARTALPASDEIGHNLKFIENFQ